MIQQVIQIELTLEEICCPLTHSGVDECLHKSVSNGVLTWAVQTYLGRLDMVVEVVAEGLDVGDVLIAALRSQVTREENCA